MAVTFSIIVPVYNVASYLHECLDSLLSQTYTNWEAICVNDGSTDISGEILDEYRSRDPRFHVIHQVNKGVSNARNEALRFSEGEYVGFLDGDDIFDCEWLASVYRLIQKTGADLIRMRFTRWSEGTVPHVATNDKYRLFSTKKDAMRYGWEIFPQNGWTWLYFFKRERIGDVRYPVGLGNCEDIIFSLRMLSNLESICQGEFAGYIYRIRSGSACRSARLADDVLRLMRGLSDVVDSVKDDGKLYNIAVRNISRTIWGSFMCWVNYNSSDEYANDFQQLIMNIRSLWKERHFTCRLGDRWSLIAYMTLIMHSDVFIVYSQFIYGMLSRMKHFRFVKRTC